MKKRRVSCAFFIVGMVSGRIKRPQHACASGTCHTGEIAWPALDVAMREPGERERIWVSGYTRKDGKKVEGYYKKNPTKKGATS